MVFPRFTADQEDPEVIAERELAALELNTTSASLRAKEASRAKEAAIVSAASVNGRRSTESDEQRPIDRSSLSSISNSSASIDTVASSTAPTGTTKASKETKAERKKRSRGVSGCSVKKDGGKFDMGFEDLEDYDYEDDDDDFAAARDEHLTRMRQYDVNDATYDENQNGRPSLLSNNTWFHDAFEQEDEEQEVEKNEEDEKHDERCSEWVELIHRAVIEQPTSMLMHFLTLLKKKSQTDIFFTFLNAVKVLYKTKLNTELVSDPFYEYKMAEIICKCEAEGIILSYTISDYLDRNFGANPGRYIDHIREMFMWTMLQRNDLVNGRLKIYSRVPENGATLAKEILAEHNLNEVTHLLQDIKPWFHADFVYELFSRAVGYMSINQTYYAVQCCLELYEATMLSKESMKIGIRRLVREVPEMEKDLPCAASLVHLLFSYAISMLPITVEDKEDLSPPKHMLYGSLVGDGRVEVCDPPSDLKVLTADNFIYLDE